MKKKKLLSLVSLSTVTVYLICIILIYFTSFSSLSLIFKTFCYDKWVYVYEAINDFHNDRSGSEATTLNPLEIIFDLQAELIDSGCNNIAFFDKKGNLVAKSGNYLEIVLDGEKEPLYCKLDEFLTEDMKGKIADFLKNNRDTGEYYDGNILKRFTTSEFSYNIRDGEIIPVEIIIDATYTGESIGLKFSDEKAEKEFIFDDKNKVFINFNESVINNDKENKNVREIMSSESFLDNVRNCTGDGVGFQDEEMGCWLTPVDVGEEELVLFFCVMREPYIAVLRSDFFLESAAVCTFIFIVLGAFLLIYLKKIADKNEQLEESRVAFTSGAAHELKTPLTVITNQCECIIENITPEKNEDYINSIYTEALRMNKLVATLLQYNKVNSISSVKKEKVDILNVAETEIDKYNWLFEDKNIHLQVNLIEAEIDCNDELIALVVDNFLSNAVKHTKKGGVVKVSLEKERKRVKFSVFNEGEHISSEDAKHIWEEFYKKDKARSRNDNSTGMGLAVCKRILSLHGFKYGYKNVKGGVEFYFISSNN